MQHNFHHASQCLGAVSLFFAVCFFGPYANAKSIEFVGKVTGHESDLIYPAKRSILVFSNDVGVEIIVSNPHSGPKIFQVEVHDRFGEPVAAMLSDKTITLQQGHRQKLRVLVSLKNLDDNVFSVCLTSKSEDQEECGTYTATLASGY